MEKRIDVAKRLALPPSAQNLIIAKKREIREQTNKSSTSAEKRKMGKESTCSELESVSLPGTGRPKYQTFLTMGHPAEKYPKIAAATGIENFSASDGWISHLNQHHSLVLKKLARESASVDTNTLDLWYERRPKLLKEYEA